MAQLDLTSRTTIGRFGLKVCLAGLIAALGKTSYLLATSGWLALYAIFTAVAALLLRQQFLTKTFNHWDEATWLTTVSLGLWAVYKALP